MSARAIADVLAWEALDSRGRPTVGCRVRLAGGAEGRAIAPSGASTGRHEAHERRDGGARHEGRGVLGAVAALRDELAPAVRGLDAGDQAAVDAAIEAVDGTPSLGRVGANAALALSLAVLEAAADDARVPLWRLLAGPGAGPLLPLPMVNVISGGAHAARAVDIQDVLVVPVGARSFAEAIEWAARVRAATARVVGACGGVPALVADEGGIAAPPGSNEDALAAVVRGIEEAGLVPGEDAALAIDVAATQLAAPDGAIRLATEGRTLARDAWLAELAGWCARHPVVSIEDPLGEDDWDGWREAARTLGHGRQLLGDDLFATSTARIREAGGAAGAVLVKPNQAGTVTRTVEASRAAVAAGLARVVSARSGDTEDAWLADLAVGLAAGQIKVGSTTRSERTAKWNRLLELEAEHAGAARFAGAEALARGR